MSEWKGGEIQKTKQLNIVCLEFWLSVFSVMKMSTTMTK